MLPPLARSAARMAPFCAAVYVARLGLSAMSRSLPETLVSDAASSEPIEPSESMPTCSRGRLRGERGLGGSRRPEEGDTDAGEVAEDMRLGGVDRGGGGVVNSALTRRYGLRD